MPKLSMPGRGARRRRRRHGRHRRPEGRAPLHHVRQARRRGDLRGARARRDAPSSPTRRRSRTRSIGKELYEVRNTRQPFQKGFIIGGPLVNLSIATKGRLPGGRLVMAPQRREADVHRRHARTATPSPTASTPSTSSPRVFITGNATRDDAPNHIRVQKHVPREIAETWRWMCPAGVYEIPEDAPESGAVDVIVNYTNCVQCGAITAKGGRLTPPEGGDGPLYTIT